MSFKCIQCGWCCKANPLFEFREGLWKEGLTDDQIELVQKQHDLLGQDHGGCPMLILDGVYKCLVEKELGIKPPECVKYPYKDPDNWCYQFMKDKIKTTEIEDGKLKITTKTGDVKYFGDNT